MEARGHPLKLTPEGAHPSTHAGTEVRHVDCTIARKAGKNGKSVGHLGLHVLEIEKGPLIAALDDDELGFKVNCFIGWDLLPYAAAPMGAANGVALVDDVVDIECRVRVNEMTRKCVGNNGI